MFIDYCKLTNSLTVDILGMNEKVLEMFSQTLEILTKPKCRIGINFSHYNRDSYILSNQRCITRNRLNSSARNYYCSNWWKIGFAILLFWHRFVGYYCLLLLVGMRWSFSEFCLLSNHIEILWYMLLIMIIGIKDISVFG